MAPEKRRGVTRGYVWMIIIGCAFLALSATVFGWGMTAMLLMRNPVESSVAIFAGPGLVTLGLAALIWSLWQQSLQILRGHTAVPVGRIFLTGAVIYLLWVVGGLLAGMRPNETWQSVFPVEFALFCVCAALLCWLILVRRVYTDRPTPRWPWEHDEPEQEIQRLNDLWNASDSNGEDDQPPRERL